MLVLMIALFANYTYAKTPTEQLLADLKNVPKNELASCRVKSNDFVFFCHLNRRNYYNCKIGLGMQFTLPKCEPVACKSDTGNTVKSPEIKSISNLFLDAILKSKQNNIKEF